MATTPFSSSTNLLIFLVILQGFVMPYRAVAKNVLYSGETLYADDKLVEGNYVFIMQTDCNLVLYSGGSAVWSSHTAGKAYNCRAAMESDANLVVYSGYGKALWTSNTARSQGHYVLVLQRDRNVVIYGGAIWATTTNVFGTPNAIMSKNSTKLP